MSILFIGKSSFLARAAQNSPKMQDHIVLDQEKALSGGNWPIDVTCVVNFATDPRIKDGGFSNLDHKYARIAKDKGAAYIMLSSRTVYGISETPAIFIEEQKPTKMILPYGHGKRQIEEDLIENFDHVTVLRLSNIFGFEYSVIEPRPTFMGMMLKNLKESNVITFNMSPQTQRDFLPVSTFTAWLNHIIQHPRPGIYNLGSGFGTSTGDIANWIIEGYRSGSLKHTRKDIIDGFVLNMSHTRKNFNIPQITSEEIKQFCIAIGKKLYDV